MIIDQNSSVSTSTATSARTRPGDAAKTGAADTRGNSEAVGKKPVGDSVSLSDKAQAMGRLEAKIADSPDVDEAKVAAVKTAIAEGRYQVDSQTVADRMLKQDSSLLR